MKPKSRIQLVLWTMFLIMTLPLSVNATDGQIRIAQTPSTTFPIRIDQPGSYVLTGDITGGTYTGNIAIHIMADNITLDLNGHSIIGPGKEGNGIYGIYAYGKSNIVIKNGTVRDFGVMGIALDSCSGGIQIKDINAFNNGNTGISPGSGALIVNCTATNNGAGGIFGRSSTIVNCIGSYNGTTGIEGSDNIIIGSTANANGIAGISASASTISNSTSNGNTKNGVVGSDLLISNCTANNNGLSGFLIDASTITNCTANKNYLFGIGSSFFSNIINCTAYDNINRGIDVAEHCRVEGNNLRGNKYGLFVISSNNYIIKNSASGNSSGNFYIQPGTSNYMPTSLTAPDAANANIGW